MRKSIATKIEDGFEAKAEIKCHVNDGFFINDRDTLIKLHYDSILWVESCGDYSIIHMEKHKYCIHKGIGQLEQWLDTVNGHCNSIFLRISRTNILNSKMINKIMGNMLFIGDASFLIAPS